jgi:hypothetical protein
MIFQPPAAVPAPIVSAHNTTTHAGTPWLLTSTGAGM